MTTETKNIPKYIDYKIISKTNTNSLEFEKIINEWLLKGYVPHSNLEITCVHNSFPSHNGYNYGGTSSYTYRQVMCLPV